MSRFKAVELCLVCGLVIRDDANGVRVAIPHYHWSWITLKDDDNVAGDYQPTVCAHHIGGENWVRGYVNSRLQTDPIYKTAFMNATAFEDVLSSSERAVIERRGAALAALHRSSPKKAG
jgi:hypothetical protein